MRVPHPVLHKTYIRFTFVFFLGMVLGSILMTLYLGNELNSLYTQNIELQYEQENLRIKIEQMDKELKSWDSRSKVKDVIIHLEKAPSGIVEAEIHRMIIKETNYLIGKDINSLVETHQSLLRIFSPKIYTVQSQAFEVNLKNLVISSKIHLYLSIRKAS